MFDPLTLGLGAAKAGMGIFGAIAGQRDAVAQARAQNEAAVERYKYQLKIRERENLDQNQLWATKLSQSDLQMNAADRAASRAYGVEDLKQSQRLKKAAFTTQQLNREMTRKAGVGAASGKSGRSVSRGDRNIEAAFARSNAMVAENLLSAEVARQYREMGIADQLQSARNTAYSNVAIAPTVSMAPLEPAQLSGPGNAGMIMGIGNSLLGLAGSFQDAQIPDPGETP